MGPAQCGGANFGQPDVLEFSLLDKALKYLKGVLERVRGIVARTFEEVDRLGAAQLLEDMVDATAEVLGGCVGLEGEVLVPALDGEECLVDIRRVFIEEASEELEIRWALALAVELACWQRADAASNR